MLLVFQMVFPAPVISWIKSIGGGQVEEGGGRRGGSEAKGGLKQPFRLKKQFCAFSV